MWLICLGVSSCKPVAAAVVILQFKTTYLLSEITDIVQHKMVTAIANALGVENNTIALTFSEVDILVRVLKGVLVDVILPGFKGSPSEFASRLTDQNINLQMEAMGLKSVLMMAKPEQPNSNSSGTVTNITINSSSTSSSVLPVGDIIGGVIGGVLFIAVAGGAYIFLYQKRQKTVPVCHICALFCTKNIFKSNVSFAEFSQSPQ